MKQQMALTLDKLEDFLALSDIRLLKGLILSTHALSFWATTLNGILLWLYQLVLFYQVRTIGNESCDMKMLPANTSVD